MGTAQAVLLGILQGLTEFLPVSSSAHLVAAQHLMHIKEPPVALDVALHMGTLLAVFVVLWRSIWRVAADGLVGAYLTLRGADAALVRERAPLLPTALAVVIGTIPAGLVGVLLESRLEAVFSNVVAAGAFLICTGGILLASRWAPEGKVERAGVVRGLLVGVAQAFAPLPGISRSGVTIVAGCFCGLRRDVAGRFSFLLAIPVMIGAGAVELLHSHRSAVAGPSVAGWPLFWGVFAAAVVGALCLVLLLRVVDRGRLHWFAAYCIPAGLAMVAIGLLS
jgi:undecaprenyl-diphosphatase